MGSLIGAGGVVFGTIMSIIFQLLSERKNNQIQNRRITYQLKIDTYADAIRDIALNCTIYQHRNETDYKELSAKEDELYKKFHPIFSIIAPNDVIEEYNELRNNALDGKIKHADAYKRVVEILNFNISTEISKPDRRKHKKTIK